MKSKIIVCIILLSSTLWSQDNIIPAHPVFGYSSIRDSIKLDFSCGVIRGGGQSEFEAVLSIDSLGNITNVEFKPIFRKSLEETDKPILCCIEELLKNTTWTPSRLKSKGISSVITVPFIFLLTSNNHGYKSLLQDLVESQAGGLRQDPVVIVKPGVMLQLN